MINQYGISGVVGTSLANFAFVDSSNYTTFPLHGSKVVTLDGAVEVGLYHLELAYNHPLQLKFIDIRTNLVIKTPLCPHYKYVSFLNILNQPTLSYIKDIKINSFYSPRGDTSTTESINSRKVVGWLTVHVSYTTDLSKAMNGIDPTLLNMSSIIKTNMMPTGAIIDGQYSANATITNADGNLLNTSNQLPANNNIVSLNNGFVYDVQNTRKYTVHNSQVGYDITAKAKLSIRGNDGKLRFTNVKFPTIGMYKIVLDGPNLISPNTYLNDHSKETTFVITARITNKQFNVETDNVSSKPSSGTIIYFNGYNQYASATYAGINPGNGKASYTLFFQRDMPALPTSSLLIGLHRIPSSTVTQQVNEVLPSLNKYSADTIGTNFPSSSRRYLIDCVFNIPVLK